MPEPTIDDMLRDMKTQILKFVEVDLYLESAMEEDQKTIVIKEYEDKGRRVMVYFDPEFYTDLFGSLLPIDHTVSVMRPVIPSFNLRNSRHSIQFEKHMKEAVERWRITLSKPTPTSTADSHTPSTNGTVTESTATVSRSAIEYLLKECKIFLVAHLEE